MPTTTGLCPDCQKNLPVRQWMNGAEQTCSHNLFEKSGDELRAMFPNALPVVRETYIRLLREFALKAGV